MGNAVVEIVSPVNHRVVGLYEIDSLEKLEQKLSRCQRALGEWRSTGVEQRAQTIKRFGDLLLQRKEYLAQMLTSEMGKPINQARDEIKKCAGLCHYFSEIAGQTLAPATLRAERQNHRIILEPLGVLLGVMPWNFPYWQTCRFAVPALIAGNTIVVKSARNTPGSLQELKRCFDDSGGAKDIFQVILCDHQQIMQVIRDPRIQGVSFTGSTAGGKSVAKVAGRSIKPTILELGGSDPYLVLRDADLEKAVSECVESRLVNSGQSCIAAKRFIVERPLYEEFIELFVEKCKMKITGDPFGEYTHIGPLAKASLRAQIEDQVAESIKDGAKLVYAQELTEQAGNFVPIRVLKDVPPNCPIFQEETFGPVAPIVPAEDVDEALRLANSNSYGLGAAVFSGDLDKARKLATMIRSGMVAINRAVHSHWSVPFGGVGESGYGRELGENGLKSFVNEKVVMNY